MKLYDILRGIEYQAIGQSDAEIRAITHLSDKSSADSAYVCLVGKKNGHNYVKEALDNGASAIIADKEYVSDGLRDAVIKSGAGLIIVENTRKAYALAAANLYGSSFKSLKVIGIVGTNGKTTTAHLIYHILNSCGIPAGIIGTLGTKLGDGTALNTALTTPDPMMLYGAFDAMAKRGDKYAIIELSAHAIALEKAAAIDFYALAFTNLSRDHLDYFKTMEDYERTKHSVFINSEAINFINLDDDSGRKLLSLIGEKQNITYSITERKSVLNSNDIDFRRVYDITADYAAIYDAPNGLEIIAPENKIIGNPLYGKYNAYNLLLAISVCARIGIDIDDIAESLESFERVDGRFVVYENRGVKFIIDFAHTPDGLSNLLKAAREMTEGRLFVVFGAGGDRDRGKRPEMGRAADSGADIIILTNDNPRNENPLDIIADISSGIANKDKTLIEPDRYNAINTAFLAANSGDTIVIAGKGHEDYIELNGKKTPYSDVESVRRIIGEMR